MAPDAPLAPDYGADLRGLINRAFDASGPVPAEPPPGGTIQERIGAPPPALPLALVTCGTVTPPGAAAHPVRVVSDAEYWALCAPHRLIVLGPLLDLTRLEMEPEATLAAERRLLRAYYQRYRGVPLPEDLLAALRAGAAMGPAEFRPWLDDARERIMGVGTLEAAPAAWRSLRIDALRRGAAGGWNDRSVSLAELMSDVLLLCRAALEDVEAAVQRAGDDGGSVAGALLAMQDEARSAFETIMPTVLRPALTEEDLPEPERAAILAFASRRVPHGQDGLLHAPAPPAPVSIAPAAARTPPRADSSDVPESARYTETAAQCYARIRASLEEQIIGYPEICRRLALLGAAHLHGVTHLRLLLCGASGSGKTHAARALAHALDRPHLQIDMADVTATGWKGLDLPDVLDALARHAGDSLEGSVLHLDEVDKIRLGAGADGNSHEAKFNLMSSILALLDGQPVTPYASAREQLSTSRVLVIGSGAFGGQFARAPSTEDLVRWGWIPELAARWGERLYLRPPGRAEAIELLRSSERSVARRLGPLMTALGIHVEVPEGVLAYVADVWLRGGSDYRTAAEWLLAAARQRLIDALERGETGPQVLVPDDIAVPAPRRGPQKPR